MAELLLSKVKESELFTQEGLKKQTGVDIPHWNTYILKELIDNAIDACESAGVAPKLEIGVRNEEQSLVFSVKDNAKGFSKADLEKIIDLSTYTGTKHYYKRPTRGAQGNALLTIFAMPFVMDRAFGSSSARVMVRSRGQEYQVCLREDRISQEFRFRLAEKGNYDNSGTEITIRVPYDQEFKRFLGYYIQWDSAKNYIDFIRKYSIFNPHVELSCNILNNGFYLKSDGELHAFRGEKESIFWYSLDDFKELLYAYFRAGEIGSIKNFCIDRFRGISNSTSASELLDGMTCKRLLDLKERDSEIATLYQNLKKLTQPPGPQVLGAIGKDRFLNALGSCGEEKCYKKFERSIEHNGRTVPYVLEVAAAPSDNEESELSIGIGINHAPVYRASSDISGVLGDYNISGRDDVKILTHLSCPNVSYSNYGKSEFDIAPFKADLFEGLKHVLSPYIALREKRRRDYYRNQKAKEKADKLAEKNAKNKEKRQKQDAFTETLDEALRLASENGKYMPTIRQVFYKHRPLMQALGVAIDSKYYNTYSKLFTKEEESRGILLANREARGLLIHPRDTRPQPIDTKFANRYLPPEYEFNKVIYIEKRGFIDVLVQEEIHSRYDAALIGGQGQSTWANRKVLRKIVEKNPSIAIFCLHDCDIYGVQIKKALEKEHYIEGGCVEVVDMGLSPREAIKKQYPKETVVYKDEPHFEAVCDVVTREEYEWLRGTQEYRVWFGNRVELNVFSPGEFVRWVEGKLKEFEVTAKVLPPDDVLADKTKNIFGEKIKAIISEVDIYRQDAVLEFINIFKSIVNENKAREEIKSRLSEDLHPDLNALKEGVVAKLSSNPIQNWAHFIEKHVDEHLKSSEKQQDEIVKEAISEATDKRRLGILQEAVEWTKAEISKISKNQEN